MGLRTIIYPNNKQASYMESNELLASLAKMEASLNEVESARKQVASTVKASSDLQKEVREYVSAIKALCVNLQSWASELKVREGALSREYEEAITRVDSTCTEIIRSFGTEVEKTSADFKAQADPVIELFTKQIDKLKKHVQELKSLKEEIKKATSEIQVVKETLSQISKDLKESQENQDVVLHEIKTNVDTISAEVKNILNTLSTLTTNSNTIGNDVIKIKDMCQSLLNATTKIDTSIHTSTTQIVDTISSANESYLKAVNINRWIIVIGIILLVILQCVK